MRRFRRMKTLQKFGSDHANVHNHFNQQRHLIDRQTCKPGRTGGVAKPERRQSRRISISLTATSKEVFEVIFLQNWAQDLIGAATVAGEGIELSYAFQFGLDQLARVPATFATSQRQHDDEIENRSNVFARAPAQDSTTALDELPWIARAGQYIRGAACWNVNSLVEALDGHHSVDEADLEVIKY